MRRQLRWVILCVGLTALVQTAWAQPAQSNDQQTLDKAGAELQSGHAEAAYQRLLPLLDQQAGNPEFDALFGTAALAAHHDTQAVMAFNRCIAVQPNNGDCRLRLARAQMALNERQAAYQQLQQLKDANPPPRVAKVVNQYLGELAGEKPTEKQDLHAWVELAMGYDNNTNVAPSSSTATLPGSSPFGSGTLSLASSDASSFGQVRTGMDLETPVTSHWSFIAGADAGTTQNVQTADNSFFDSVDQLAGYLGTSAQYGKQRFGLMARAQNYRLSGDSYRNLAGVTGQYSYLASSRTRISGFLQYSRFDYQYGRGANQQNVDSTSAGVSVLQSLMQDQLVAFGGLYVGNDSKVKSDAADNVGSDYVGLRGGATWLFRQGWQAGVNVLAEQRKYGGKATFFPNKRREDTLVSSDLRLDWQFVPDWTIRAKYTWNHNDSNVPTRDYQRQIISLGVRYDFL